MIIQTRDFQTRETPPFMTRGTHNKNTKYYKFILRVGEVIIAEKTFEHGLLKAGFSGAVSIGWLVFLILFLAFYSGRFQTHEKFAIILLSIFIITVLLSGLWAFWSLRMMSKKDWEIFKIKGFKWRIIGTICYGLGLLLVLIYGFWYIWIDFDFWQYLAILLVIILISGGIMAVIWVSWGTKYRNEMDKYGKEFGKKFEKEVTDSFEKNDEKRTTKDSY